MRGRTLGRWSAIAWCGAALGASLAARGIKKKDIIDRWANSARYITDAGEYSRLRHRTLTQFTPANVSRLATMWTLQTGYLQYPGPLQTKFEASPIVVDGVIYLTGEMD